MMTDMHARPIDTWIDPDSRIATDWIYNRLAGRGAVAPGSLPAQQACMRKYRLSMDSDNYYGRQ